MAKPQLLDYIRTNLAESFSRQEIEQALVAAGWATSDVAEAFIEIEHPEAVTISPQVPVDPALASAAEEARIQQELELEAKRRKSRGSTANTNPSTASGIIGWLIRKGIVRTESQANILLIAVSASAIFLAVWVQWPTGTHTKAVVPIGTTTPQSTPE